ncbi:hypothetical protein IW262DRAFT_1299233 [Armillaria fumosa]|nr:hypothetical protein IW262DRAFT_1299233 [Armillaria fumosa]
MSINGCRSCKRSTTTYVLGRMYTRLAFAFWHLARMNPGWKPEMRKIYIQMFPSQTFWKNIDSENFCGRMVFTNVNRKTRIGSLVIPVWFFFVVSSDNSIGPIAARENEGTVRCALPTLDLVEKNLGENRVDFAITDVGNRRTRAVHSGAVYRTQGFDASNQCEGDSQWCSTTTVFPSSLARTVPGKVYNDVVAHFDIRVFGETIECFHDIGVSRRSSVKIMAI